MNKEIVLITGTNSGFGLLATIELARNGFLVIATMRDLNKKTSLIEKASELHLEESIILLELDVNNPQQIQCITNEIMYKYGGVDILINNAGYCLGGMSELVDMEDWRHQFETNFFGVVALTQAVLPSMRAKRRGKIINIGSISGKMGFPGLAPYVSSKFALEGFSESLRLELLSFQVQVSIIEAGAYKTNIWEKALSQKNDTGEKDYQGFMNLVYNYAKDSAKQAADPREVIDTLLHICNAKTTKFRYPIGKGVKSMIFLKNIIPWSVIEWFAKRKLQ